MAKYILPYTIRGKILHALIWMIYRALSIFIDFKKEKSQDFEENPLFMSVGYILQLGYNYYIQPVLENPNKNTNFIVPVDKTENIPTDALRIKFCGDIMPYQEVQKKYCKHLWDNIGVDFFDADINIGNLETPISIASKPIYTPEITLKKFVMNGDSNFFDIINGNGQIKGFDLFSTANNHSFDMRRNGLLNTIDFLTKKNVLHCGTFDSPASPRFTIIDKMGIKIAFISYTFSLNFFRLDNKDTFLINYIRLNKPDEDIEQICNDIESARKASAEFVVLLPHFGLSYHSYPPPHIRKMMHRLIKEAKPDLIVANHSHIPQQLELIDNVYCAYSLGDFIGYDITRLGKLSFVLELSLSKNSNKIEISHVAVKPFQIYFSKKHKLLQLNSLFYEPKVGDFLFGDINYLKENNFLKEYYLNHYNP